MAYRYPGWSGYGSSDSTTEWPPDADIANIENLLDSLEANIENAVTRAHAYQQEAEGAPLLRAQVHRRGKLEFWCISNKWRIFLMCILTPLLFLPVLVVPYLLIFLILICIKCCVTYCTCTKREEDVIPHPTPSRSGEIERSIQTSGEHSRRTFPFYRGNLLDVRKCTVEWSHANHAPVGEATAVTIKLFCRNNSPYVMGPQDRFLCDITHEASDSAMPFVWEPRSLVNTSTIRVSFTTRMSGRYSVDLRLNDQRLSSGGVIRRNYVPGPVDPSKTLFPDQNQVLILTENTYHRIRVVPKDRFGNAAILLQNHLLAEVSRDGPNGEMVDTECVVERDGPSAYELLLKIQGRGHYIGCVKYLGQKIGPPTLTIICLSEPEASAVERNLSTNLFTQYDAKMLQGKSSKNVSCHLSPYRFNVRDSWFGFSTRLLYTCKVCTATKVIFQAKEGQFTVDDGYQLQVTLVSPQREVLGATFLKFILRSVGGNEKFEDKRSFFTEMLTRHHSERSRTELNVEVSRFGVLESTMQATRHFTVTEWCMKFKIQFTRERGLDYGGVSRELFELLCVECFDTTSGLFKRFQDSPQALVHPNHKSPDNFTLQHYELAGKIVGKCLYESAMGYPTLVKARFTRSFLAQLIGLRMHYRYFESDDPDLWVTKIKYIMENDVTDLELVFAEEEFDARGGNPRMIPLKDRGDQIPVTEENKMEYLNLLAEYRLARCARKEIEHFLEGLNSIVPQDMLGIFDVNELELLMCGLTRVDYEELRQHAVVTGGRQEFDRIVLWFWTTVQSLTEEERARLLQFVTGSSQLPPGGLKELRPPFQITPSPSPTTGRPPTAHTCFNQICLPNYGSYKQFHSALMLAIYEGSQGFLLEMPTCAGNIEKPETSNILRWLNKSSSRLSPTELNLLILSFVYEIPLYKLDEVADAADLYFILSGCGFTSDEALQLLLRRMHLLGGNGRACALEAQGFGIQHQDSNETLDHKLSEESVLMECVVQTYQELPVVKQAQLTKYLAEKYLTEYPVNLSPFEVFSKLLYQCLLTPAKTEVLEDGLRKVNATTAAFQHLNDYHRQKELLQISIPQDLSPPNTPDHATLGEHRHHRAHPLSYADRMHRYPGVCFLGDCYCATLTSEAQEWKWEDIGLSISIPTDTIPEGDRLDLEVYPCLTGPFVLPDDYEPASPAYLIRPRYEFLKPVELTLQHCFELQTQEDCENMAFLTASSTPTNDEYTFSVIRGNRGTFQCGESVGRIALQHFCKTMIGKKRMRPGADSESNVRKHRRGNSEKLYSVRLYKKKSPTEQHLAIFTISVCHEVYIKNLTTTLEKMFPGVDFEHSIKEPVKLAAGEHKVTLNIKDIPGWKVVPDKTPLEISRIEIDLPFKNQQYALFTDYPPTIRLDIWPEGSCSPPTVCELHVEVIGLSCSCGFNLLLPQKLAGQFPTVPAGGVLPGLPPIEVHSQLPGLPKSHLTVLDERPRMNDLQQIKWDEGSQQKMLKVIKLVSNNWKELGCSFGIEESELSGLEIRYQKNQEQCCRAVLQRWLQSGSKKYPVTWSGLIDALKNSEHETLAGDLKTAVLRRIK